MTLVAGCVVVVGIFVVARVVGRVVGIIIPWLVVVGVDLFVGRAGVILVDKVFGKIVVLG